MPGPARLLVIGLLLVAGVLSGAAAFAASVGRELPEAALWVWPPAGAVYAGAATNVLVSAVNPQAKGLPTNLPVRIARLARTAILYEPTNATAMRDLGLYYDSRGNHDAARRMMNAAFAASRRDSSVNLWLTQDLARRGQGLAALQLYDITIRTDTSAAASLMTLMAQALQRPGAVSAFEQVLAAKPPWLDDFWSAVLSAPGDLTPAFELRQRLHLRGVPMAQSHDALLIEKLANSGKLEEAFALYGSVAKPSSTDELLIDSGFDTQAPFPPIGWKVSAEGTFGAAIDTVTGVLDITALPGAEGVVTQQLVRLGGSGNFAMKAIYDGTGQRTPLGLRVTCAEMDGEKTLDHMFDVPSGQTVMATFATPCRYAWISLILRRDDESAGRDIRVDSVSFRRVS